MKKKEILDHWRKLKRKRPLRPKVIPYKHKGSTFDEDGVRICGSAQFIDAVLSRLTEFLDFENGESRLQVSYQQAKDKDTGALLDSYTCYIQVHERGDEAKMANALASALTGKQTIISKGY